MPESRAEFPLPDAVAIRPGKIFAVGRGVLRPFFLVFFRPLIRGAHHIPSAGPVLLVSNHLSAVDTLLIPSFTPRPVQFLAKESLFTGRLRNWFFRSIGAIPVHRDAGAGARSALEAGRDVLAAGNVFAVFPEGSRSVDGRLYRGRSGAAWMAMAADATVIPVGLVGTNRALRDPVTGRAPRVSMTFGPPVLLGDLECLPAGRARREATERIMCAIQEITLQDRATGFAAGGRGA